MTPFWHPPESPQIRVFHETGAWSADLAHMGSKRGQKVTQKGVKNDPFWGVPGTPWDPKRGPKMTQKGVILTPFGTRPPLRTPLEAGYVIWASWAPKMAQIWPKGVILALEHAAPNEAKNPLSNDPSTLGIHYQMCCHRGILALFGSLFGHFRCLFGQSSN